MESMFNGCSKLTSLILTNFDTSLVTKMNSMFSSCSSLKELDLSSFRIPLVNNTASMFSNCKKLIYVNLNNSYERNDSFVSNMFDSNPINLAICFPSNNTKINGSLSKLTCHINDCSNDWKIPQ